MSRHAKEKVAVGPSSSRLRAQAGGGGGGQAAMPTPDGLPPTSSSAFTSLSAQARLSSHPTPSTAMAAQKMLPTAAAKTPSAAAAAESPKKSKIAADGQVRKTSSNQPSGHHVGNFHLGDCLGKGAFGSVYRGLNWMTGETVAVKQVRLGNIPKGELHEIMAEIDLLRNLKHPNIVKYKGSEKTREYLFIILEYCENGSLQHICKRFGKFPEGLVGVYISQILDGLVYLHDQGVIHRDIKGANILTTKDGSVKLADFGVATKAGSLLASNTVVGSPYWMAPEVIDQSGATTASDIWSVGAVVIELLEGKPPYHFLDPMPALFRIVQDDCPPLPEGASPVVKDFLMHCFQKDANLRISAKKLSRHPWMMSSRRQLEQMRTGGSVRSHAEAVKSVKEWNEAISEPTNVASHSKESKAPLLLPHRRLATKAQPSLKLSTSAAQAGGGGHDNVSHAFSPIEVRQKQSVEMQKPGTIPASDVSDKHSAPHPSAESPVAVMTQRSPLTTSMMHNQLELLSAQERETDNWDDDFEEGIATAKLNAIDHQRLPNLEAKEASAEEGMDIAEDEDDDFATIRPANLLKKAPTNGAVPKTKAGSDLEPIADVSSVDEEDYSDLMPDNDLGQLDRQIEKFRISQSGDGKLLRPSDLADLPAGTSNAIKRSPKPSLVLPQNGRSTSEQDIRAFPSPSSFAALPASPSGAVTVSKSSSEKSLVDYAETQDEEDDFSDLMPNIGAAESHLVPELKLADRLHSKQWPGEGELEEEDDDPFRELEEDDIVGSADLEANIARDKHARMCAHTIDLFERLSVNTSEDVLIDVCDELELILTEQPDMKAHALAAHGALTIIELLEAIQIRDVISRLLGLLNVIIYQDALAQENLCLIGAIPVVMPFCSKNYPHHVRIEAAHFIFAMCSSSTLTLQFVLSCRGLKTLVELVDEEYTQQKDLVWLGVACVNGVLELQSPASRNDFCRMLANEGLLEPLSTALLCVLEDDEQAEYTSVAREHILQILLIYSASDTRLKQQVATRSVLRRLLQACRILEPFSLTKMLKVLKNLTMSPAILDEVENCNAIEVLVNILLKSYAGPCGTEISNQILNALYNLCRLNVRRQEEAAQAGVIPHLVRVAKTPTPLKQFALPILCDMAHASKSTRKMLSQQCGVSFFLDLLQDPNWQLQSLESICVWLQGDLARIEDHLLRPHSVQALLYVFVTSKSLMLENLLETLLKVFKLSSGITLALGKQSLFLKRLADRLQANGKTIVRLNLLRMCKAICDVHPDMHAHVRQFGLLETIQTLAHDDGAVLVRELAREIVAQLQGPSDVPSLVAKDVHRTVRRAASESNVAVPVNSSSAQSSPHRQRFHMHSQIRSSNNSTNSYSMQRSTANRN